MPKPVKWQKIKTSGDLPTGRLGHTMTEMQKNVYILFGGLDGSKKEDGTIVPTNQVFTLKLNTKGECHWTANECDGDEVPLPRSNHSAAKIGEQEMLIFGGYFSSKQRLNDVHILKVSSTSKKYTWLQPENQKIGKAEPKNTESKIGAPDPRANHSATFIPDLRKVYIFGGHGGIGYSRKAFNDIYSFDIDTKEWTKLQPGGSCPKERGGHSACLMPDSHKIFIYGGWSNISQYSNFYLFDADKPEWVDLDAPTDMPRWNHSAVMVPALPKWMLFVFGGERGDFEEGSQRQFGNLDNSIAYIVIKEEIKGTKFTTVNCTKEMMEDDVAPPIPRENSCMVYDRSEQRLIVFGGWSGKYLNDIYEIAIGGVTGPEYAIYKIEPTLGPYTGGTNCTITGEGFLSNRSYRVQFTSGKNMLESSATFISSTEIQCSTPSFYEYGPKEVEVRVLVERGDLTLTKATFNYFLNTVPEKTIAFGPGVLKRNSLKADTVFYIQARNKLNENRKSGQDEMIVKIFYKAKNSTVNDKGESEEVITDEEIEVKSIEDENNGLYKVTYAFNQADTPVYIDVKTRDENKVLKSIRGSPFCATFEVGIPAYINGITSKKMISYNKGKLEQIQKFLKKTNTGIDTTSGTYETDIKELLRVKENIQKVEENKEQLMLELETIEASLDYFERVNQPKKAECDSCKHLIGDLTKISEKSESAEKDTASFVKKQGEETKHNIEQFETTLKRYYLNLKQKDIYRYD